MSDERRAWGRIAEDAGWTINGWSANILTMGDMFSWAEQAKRERERAKKARK